MEGYSVIWLFAVLMWIPVTMLCFSLITTLQPFNGPFSGTTRVSRYQKRKTNLDFTGARDSEWPWHQLGHMQVCTSLQTDNHTSTPPLSFFTGRMPSCRSTNSVKALKAPWDLIFLDYLLQIKNDHWPFCNLGCMWTSMCIVFLERFLVMSLKSLNSNVTEEGILRFQWFSCSASAIRSVGGLRHYVFNLFVYLFVCMCVLAYQFWHSPGLVYYCVSNFATFMYASLLSDRPWLQFTASCLLIYFLKT